MNIAYIIKPLEEELAEIRSKESKLVKAINLIKELNLSADKPEDKPNEIGQEVPRKPVKIDRQKKTKTANQKKGVSTKKYGRSKYKGVSRMNGKWRAQFYIPGQGNKHIGSFETEELAHIAYEKFKAAYQEQIENNPDRPEKEYYYVCNHCGLKYDKKPDNCRGCNSTSFGKRKVQSD